MNGWTILINARNRNRSTLRQSIYLTFIKKDNFRKVGGRMFGKDTIWAWVRGKMRRAVFQTISTQSSRETWSSLKPRVCMRWLYLLSTSLRLSSSFRLPWLIASFFFWPVFTYYDSASVLFSNLSSPVLPGWPLWACTSILRVNLCNFYETGAHWNECWCCVCRPVSKNGHEAYFPVNSVPYSTILRLCCRYAVAVVVTVGSLTLKLSQWLRSFHSHLNHLSSHKWTWSSFNAIRTTPITSPLIDL